MVRKAIESLLAEKIGLDPNSMGTGNIARAIGKRMAACGDSDEVAYWQRLQVSPAELAELIESVVVPETWFLRDREPFVFLKNYLVSQWLPHPPREQLRVLSIPAATGEEPYSIAITLTEAGLSAKQFTLDAVDISQNALIKAKRGVYGKNSFRGTEAEFLQRYFQPVTGGETSKHLPEYAVISQVRAAVNFIPGNLLDKFFMLNKINYYDIIFCRNLLIYFHRHAKEEAMAVINRLLVSGGLLFVGHSESALPLAAGFELVRHPRAFAYRKPQQPREAAIVPNGKLTAKPFPPNLPLLTGRPPAIALPSAPPAKKPEPSRDSQPPNAKEELSPLELAKDLADKGQLQEAASLCETYIQQNITSTEAYLLLGQVQQGLGNPEAAEKSFQRALYLQPDCLVALVHLALLKENRGDTAGAAIIRARIQRRQIN
ncbi:MAG TPA: chemotaxis protein [Oscillatoriaceae cyanobacterium M33_DOE_052]|uniref:Chemotaxis protein n=1 Tax=Planktothricoides sp. SpSt-374 TaxID=2282167 RepID=A0A7C3ZF11_9CYAN|nr:chemotaxis protein [Oscillatoriaceae cyanobacterium M33_DOE_052]